MYAGFPVFHIYVLVGLVFAAIAFLGYTFGESQPTQFYWAAWVCFNSVFSGGVCFVIAMTFPTS
jgi:hypothetical protein